MCPSPWGYCWSKTVTAQRWQYAWLCQISKKEPVSSTATGKSTNISSTDGGHMGYIHIAYKGKLMQVNRGIMYIHCKLAISYSRIFHVSLSSRVISQYMCGCAGNKNGDHRRLLGLLARIVRNSDKNKTLQNIEMGRVYIKTKGSHKMRLCLILSQWVPRPTMWRAC